MLGKSKTVRTIRHFTRFYVVYLLEAKENKHLKYFIKKSTRCFGFLSFFDHGFIFDEGYVFNGI